MDNTEIKTIELIVNSQDAKKKLEELNSRLVELKKKREEALEKGNSKGLEVYSREIRKVENEMRRTETRADTMKRALQNLDKSTPNELKKTLKELNKELNSGKVQRGSKEWDTLTQAIRETKDALQRVNGELKTVQQSSWSDRLAEWGNKWFGLVQNIQAGIEALSGIKSLMQQTVSYYATMEEAMAQVQKYTGLTKDETNELNESLKNMNTRTSREQLNALAGDAGKLGITAKDKILDFVSAADKINVALGDDLGDGAVKNVGKLAMLFEEDKRMGLKKAMLSTASVINEISQNSSAGAQYLEEFTARVAGVGKQAKMSQADIMGYAAVLDESMQEDETSATAFSQLLTKMFQEPTKFAKLAGQNVKQFTYLLKHDANEALLTFFASMKAKGGFADLAPMFEQMGLDGTRATSVLSSVADKLENVKEMQKLANESYKEAVSINNEFNVQNNTVQAGLDKAKKSMLDLRVELGEKLMPLATHMLSVSSLTLKVLSALISFVTTYKKQLVVLITVIVTYNAIVKYQTIIETFQIAVMKLKNLQLLAFIKNTSLYNTVARTFIYLEGLINVAMTLYTRGVHAARVEFALLNATMKRNLFGLIAMVLAVVIGKLLTYTGLLEEETEEEKENIKVLTRKEEALNKCNEAQQTATQKHDEEAKRVEYLRKIIQDNTRSINDRQKAIYGLQKIVPGYHASLNKEGELTERNTEAIKDYLDNLKKKALAEALYDKLKEAMQKKAHADMAKESWDKTINTWDARLERPEYASQKETSWGYTWEGGLRHYEKETNALRERAVQQSYLARERQVFWQKEQKNAQETIDIITNYAKSQNVGEMVDDLVANGGNIDYQGQGKSFSGGKHGAKGGKKDDPVRAALERIEKWKLAQELAQRILYEQGRNTKREYDDNMLDIEAKSLEKQKVLYTKGSKERLDIELKLRENQRKAFQLYDEWSLADIARQEREENDAAQRSYIKGELKEEAYQCRLDEIKLTHLRKRQSYYEGTGDTDNADRAREAADAEDMAQKLARRKEYMEKATAMEREYMKKSIDERQKDEERLLDDLIREGVIAEDKKQAFMQEIRDKYDKLRKDEADKNKNKPADGPLGAPGGIAGDFISIFENIDKLQAKIKDGKATWEDYAAVAVASLSFVSAGMQAMSQLFSAQQREEEAAVTSRYDKEIKKAGENSRRGKKLEEQKQKELAKVKNKYRKKQMAMEIAQAVASTAMAAINSYASASKVSWLLGPIAAAMATAAGMIQIAAIKKQHAAEADGYYAGGFTGGTDYRRAAGTVHEGEFVANHLAVQNPNIMPVLSLIDRAQRNNTVAALTAADVSRTLSAPAATAANTAAISPAVQIVDTSSGRTAEAIDRLNLALEQGIHASVSITGDDGLERQWTRYNRMKQRK